MMRCTHFSRTSVGDAGLLLLLMTAQIVGYIAAIASLSWLLKAGCLLAFEAVLLLWVAAWQAPRAERRGNLGFALRLQAHAATQVLPALYFIGGCGVLTHAALAYVEPQGPWSRYMSSANLFRWHDIALTLALLGSQLLGAARLHALHRMGLRIADVAAGALNRAQLTLPAAESQVRSRLAFYLRQLTLPGAPALHRLWYGSTPRIVERDGAYLLSWRDCPSRMRVQLAPGHPAEPGTCLLTMECALRGGFQRLDLMVNPIDAIAIGDFLQANVVRLLSSEFALAALNAHQGALRQRTAEMQLRMLQAQIEPHFLFNTLANVRQLYRGDAAAGEAMLGHLIDYLHGAMDELRAHRSTVAREFDLARHYLEIMKIRMGERLSVQIEDAGPLAEHDFPPAMLMSLVENAIMHGLHHQPHGVLTIAAAVADGQLRVSVRDNGAGFSTVQGSGTGLSNIRQRLEALYGKHAWLEAGALEQGGFVSTMIIPFTPLTAMTPEA